MRELKPCPFCGKEVFLLDVETRSSAYSKWDVYCRTHGCFLNSGTNNMFSNREDAMIAWNTRAESRELITLREQVKVLREALYPFAAMHCNEVECKCNNCLAMAALDRTKPKDGERI